MSIVSFIFINLSLAVIIDHPPASGYEASIYNVYPWYFWFFIISSIVCGIIILVYEASIERPAFWWLGFLPIFFVNLIVLLLPFFRGYITVGRYDALSHIGYVKDILSTGHFYVGEGIEGDYYPAIHVLVAVLAYTTHIYPETLAEILPIFFILFYIISIYLLSRTITLNKSQTLTVTAFGSLLLFKHENLMFAPAVQCFFLLPFTLFLYFKLSLNSSLRYYILYILILLLTPFLHPGEGTLFLLVSILCITISIKFYNRCYKTNDIRLSLQNNTSMISLILLIVTWFIWFANFSIFIGTIERMYRWFMYGIGKTDIEEVVGIVKSAELNINELIDLLFRQFGDIILYFVVAVVSSISVLKKVICSKNKPSAQEFLFTSLFVTFSMLMLIAFFNYFGGITYNRVMRYTIFTATILNGIWVYNLLQAQSRKIRIIIAVVMIVLLAISSIFAIFTVFKSPAVGKRNNQVTNMEVYEMKWFIEHRDEKLRVTGAYFDPFRFANLVVGIKETSKNIPQFIPNALPPDHFGYNNMNQNLGELYTKDIYFMDSIISRIPIEVFPKYLQNKQLWKFLPDDFQRLEVDITVSKIYSNKECWVYYVYGSM